MFFLGRKKDGYYEMGMARGFLSSGWNDCDGFPSHIFQAGFCETKFHKATSFKLREGQVVKIKKITFKTASVKR